jgi:hypothetical protein
MASRAIPFEKVTVIEVARLNNQTLVMFSDGKITILDTDDTRPPPYPFASDLLMKSGDGVTIVGTRTTDDGLLVRFSDGEFYLFRSSFLVDNRAAQADRIRPGQWLTDNWKRQGPKI